MDDVEREGGLVSQLAEPAGFVDVADVQEHVLRVPPLDPAAVPDRVSEHVDGLVSVRSKHGGPLALPALVRVIGAALPRDSG